MRAQSVTQRHRVTDADTNRGTVVSLMAILSGEAPIESGAALFAPDVVLHVDGWTFEGVNTWASWIRYIRLRGRVAQPVVLVDEIAVAPDATVTVKGRWRGLRDGRTVTSKTCTARYRFSQGRIVEVWSTKTNYTLLCGWHLFCHVGFVIELLRAKRWKSLTPQLDLTGGVRAPHVPFLTASTGALAPAD